MILSKNLLPFNKVHWISRNKLCDFLVQNDFGESILDIKIVDASEINQNNKIKSLTEINQKIIILVLDSFSIFIALPFPFSKKVKISSVLDIEKILKRDILIGLIFFELGSYVLGSIRFNSVDFSKKGSRYVKGRHKAGGQSQRRFERNREKWIEELYKKLFVDIKDHLYPQKEKLDFLVLCGDTHIINDLLSKQKIEKLFGRRFLIRKSNLKNYNSKTLIKASITMWSSKIYIDDKNAIVKEIGKG